MRFNSRASRNGRSDFLQSKLFGREEVREPSPGGDPQPGVRSGVATRAPGGGSAERPEEEEDAPGQPLPPPVSLLGASGSLQPLLTAWEPPGGRNGWRGSAGGCPDLLSRPRSAEPRLEPSSPYQPLTGAPGGCPERLKGLETANGSEFLFNFVHFSAVLVSFRRFSSALGAGKCGVLCKDLFGFRAFGAKKREICQVFQVLSPVSPVSPAVNPGSVRFAYRPAVGQRQLAGGRQSWRASRLPSGD